MDHSETDKTATAKDWLDSSRNFFNHSNDDKRKPNLHVKNEDQGTAHDFKDDQQCLTKEPSLPEKQTGVKGKTIEFIHEKIFVPQIISTPAASNSPPKQWQHNQSVRTTSFRALPSVMSPMKLPKLVLQSSLEILLSGLSGLDSF